MSFVDVIPIVKNSVGINDTVFSSRVRCTVPYIERNGNTEYFPSFILGLLNKPQPLRLFLVRGRRDITASQVPHRQHRDTGLTFVLCVPVSYS